MVRVKNWFKYIKNFSLNKFTHNKIPYSAQIELTLRCNATCPFCSIPILPKLLIKNEMNTNQVKYIIDQVAKLGVNILSFTGGEPTLRKDLPELIQYTEKTHDFIIGVATNGYLMPKLFKENGGLKGLDYILLSIDYPEANLHDNKRGIKTFDKALETINIACKKDIKVIINTVVMKDNINSLEKICALAEQYDVAIELYPCEDIIREFHNEKFRIMNIEKSIPDIPLWANLIYSLRKKFKNILTDPFSVNIIKEGGFGGFPNYYQQSLRCHVAEAYLFVRWDGYIDFPCKLHPIVSINALKHPLSLIYNIKEVKEVIHHRDDFNFCNGCYFGCAIVSSLPTKWKALFSKYVQGYFKGNLK
ncbi:MAG: radical SAM protein [Candidatus Hodarchaeota archaeon]